MYCVNRARKLHPSVHCVMAFLRSAARYNHLLFTRKATGKASSLDFLSGQCLNATPVAAINLLSIFDQRNTPRKISVRYLSQRGHNDTKPDAQGGTRANSTVAAAGHLEQPQRDPLDVKFSDPNAAFKSKTTFELIRAYLVYLVCSSSYLVEHNMKVYILWVRISQWLSHASFIWDIVQKNSSPPTATETCLRLCCYIINLQTFPTQLCGLYYPPLHPKMPLCSSQRICAMII